jgi:putative hemolysin
MREAIVAGMARSYRNTRARRACDSVEGMAIVAALTRARRRWFRTVMTAGAFGLLIGCTARPAMTEAALPKAVGLPNPASVHCLEVGGKLHMERSENGGEFGVCDLPDGQRCEEWALFRGECGKGPPAQGNPSPADPERGPSGSS